MTSVNEVMSDNSYINLREMLKDCISDVQVRPANIGCRNLESKLPVLLSSTNHGYSRYYGGGYIVARQTDIGEGSVRMNIQMPGLVGVVICHQGLCRSLMPIW